MPKATNTKTPEIKAAADSLQNASQLPAALLNAFNTNNRINLYLIESISPEAWKAKPPDGKGRTIAAIVAHIRGQIAMLTRQLGNVRVMWLKVFRQGRRDSAAA